MYTLSEESVKLLINTAFRRGCTVGMSNSLRTLENMKTLDTEEEIKQITDELIQLLK